MGLWNLSINEQKDLFVFRYVWEVEKIIKRPTLERELPEVLYNRDFTVNDTWLKIECDVNKFTDKNVVNICFKKVPF